MMTKIVFCAKLSFCFVMLQSIVTSVKWSITKQHYIAVLNIFPVLDRYRQIKPELDITLEVKNVAI